MLIPVWLIATIIFIALLVVTPFCFRSKGWLDFATPIFIAAFWAMEIIGYLIFWIILLAFFN